MEGHGIWKAQKSTNPGEATSSYWTTKILFSSELKTLNGMYVSVTVES